MFVKNKTTSTGNIRRQPGTQERKEDYLEKITAVQAKENFKSNYPGNLRRLLSQPFSQFDLPNEQLKRSSGAFCASPMREGKNCDITVKIWYHQPLP